MDRIEDYVTGAEAPAPEAIDRAFWGACHGGRQGAAEYLVIHGADLNWLPPWEDVTPLDAAARSKAVDLVRWLREQGAKSASELAR